MVYFVLSGLLTPSYDRIHFNFLLDTALMDSEKYDILSIFPHIGVAIGTFIYFKFMRDADYRKVLIFSLVLRVLQSSLVLFNISQIKNPDGPDPFLLNIPVFLISKASHLCFGLLPATLALARSLP